MSGKSQKEKEPLNSKDSKDRIVRNGGHFDNNSSKAGCNLGCLKGKFVSINLFG